MWLNWFVHVNDRDSVHRPLTRKVIAKSADGIPVTTEG
jgi:hypothetical protein